jgi:7-cyano-7-deazaguanine synthase
MTEKVLVVVSGGLDSTTLLYHVINENPDAAVYAISFNYGQRHKKELEYARHTCNVLGLGHAIVDITSITGFLDSGQSSLIASDLEVPEGHYAEENMKATVVPNRNMIMASIAAGHAVAIGASSLWMGVHAGDHFIYPDCRPEFFRALNAAIVRGNSGFGAIPVQHDNAWPSEFVMTPFINSTKADIALEALRRGIPLEDTWSCYKGGDVHCGKCGTCVERLEAINEAQETLASLGEAVPADNTVYEDQEFWKEALKRETVR